MVFGFVWLRDQLVVYDVSVEREGDCDVHVASLSADPMIRFTGQGPDAAVGQLLAYLRR